MRDPIPAATRLGSLWAAVGVGLIAAGGCAASWPRLPAAGTVAGANVMTTVDSEIARYYLEDFPRRSPSRSDLEERLSALLMGGPKGVPDAAELGRLSRQGSVDLAALVFADRAARHPIQAEFAANLATDNVEDLTTARTVVFVPGFAYRSHPETGGDLSVPRAVLAERGVRQRFVETDETASVEANADRVAEVLVEVARGGEEILVVSASKGGPEVALALARLQARDSAQVRAWISIGGLLGGTPLADEALRGPRRWVTHTLLWLKGWRRDGVRSLATAASRRRSAANPVPGHVLVLHYVAVPLSGDLSARARGGYRKLRRHGPNDGLTLLADELLPMGVPIVEMGTDHFFTGRSVERTTLALLKTVEDRLERGGQELSSFDRLAPEEGVR